MEKKVITLSLADTHNKEIVEREAKHKLTDDEINFLFEALKIVKTDKFQLKNGVEVVIRPDDDWPELYDFQRQWRSENDISAPKFLKLIDCDPWMKKYCYSENEIPSKSGQGLDFRNKLRKLKSGNLQPLKPFQRKIKDFRKSHNEISLRYNEHENCLYVGAARPIENAKSFLGSLGWDFDDDPDGMEYCGVSAELQTDITLRG